MGKISCDGLDEYINKLGVLTEDAHKINRGALGEAAGFVADEMREAVSGMPTISLDERLHGKNRLNGATDEEMAQILGNLGIRKFTEGGGSITTQIGFGGYVNTPSKKFNDNVPTGMLVQCINYGTAFRNGTHTLDRLTSSIKGAVSQKIQEYIDDEVSKIM